MCLQDFVLERIARICFGILPLMPLNMLDIEKHCTAVRWQIDKFHLPCRMRMQSLEHNDSDAQANGSKTHDALEVAAYGRMEIFKIV